MKKIALALVAVSALGLAACDDRNATTNTADTNTEPAVNEANADLGNAQDAAGNALDGASATPVEHDRRGGRECGRRRRRSRRERARLSFSAAE